MALLRTRQCRRPKKVEHRPHKIPVARTNNLLALSRRQAVAEGTLHICLRHGASACVEQISQRTHCVAQAHTTLTRKPRNEPRQKAHSRTFETKAKSLPNRHHRAGKQVRPNVGSRQWSAAI